MSPPRPDEMSSPCPQCGAPVRTGAKFCIRCGVRLAAAGLPGTASASATGMGALASGTDLLGGRYRILGQLGQGGMGAVYLARDRDLFGRLCVVKQMRPFFASQSERRKAEADFKREAELLVQLNQPGHPHIPEVYAYFVEAGSHYLAMKYVEGESLESRLARAGHPLHEAEVVHAAVQVADALVYLHSRRPEPVVHRDVKPANIIVDPEGRVWLVDFGLAKATAGVSGSRVVISGGKTVAAGTPGYTPPEQWRLQTAPRSDIYALGATLHHLLSGHDPRDRFAGFAELNLALLEELAPLPSLGELRPALSPQLLSIVDRCLDADPRHRPEASQVKEALAELLPSGSQALDAVRRWSPTLGRILGIAMATFVQMLFGRRSGTVPDGRRAGSQRGRFTCLYCRGSGTTRAGTTCPVCGGTGTW
jgi:serine/threonine protein kinase